MSDADASVRLNLEAAGFLSALRALEKHSNELAKAVEGVGDGAEKASRKTSLLSSSMKTGFGAAKSSLAELGSTLKSTLATAATLGGALSVGAGIHGAQDLISTYKDIAFAIQSGTGQVTHWLDVQKNVEGVASKWKRSNEEVAASFKQIYDDVGDAKFAAAAIEEVAKSATAGAGSVENLSRIAGSLNEKFGVTATQLPDAMASVIAAANKGGMTMEEFASYLGNIGAAAKAVGIQGPEGLKKVVGMLNIAEGSTKSMKAGISGMSALLTEFGDPTKIDALQKKLGGINLKDRKGNIKSDIIETVLVKTKGDREKLAALEFQGEGKKIMADFGETFKKAHDATKGTEAKKNAAGLAAFNAAIEAASKQTLSATQLEEQATARLKDPARQLEDAMNRFKKAFERPEVIEAVNKLSEAMPKLASALGDVVGFVAEHPMGAAAAFVGAKVGGAGLASTGASLLGGLAKDAGAGIGKQIGLEFAESAAKSGKWAAAGDLIAKTSAVAIGAMVAYELGKAAIDKLEKEDAGNQNDLASSRAALGAAQANGDPVMVSAARKRLQDAVDKAKEDETGVTGTVKRGFRGAASFFGGTDVDPQADAIARAEADLRTDAPGRKGGGSGEAVAGLTKGLTAGGKASEKAAAAHDRAAAAADRFAKSLDRAAGAGGGGSSANGLPPAPSNASGSNAS